MINEKNSLQNVSGAIPSMAALLAFEAAARCGSFADAAKQLGRTPSAVSHAIRDLEDRVGETLFERRGRSVTLTEAGAAY
ncbi:MAG: LysR family transcriptional regulator, partial [Pseudomonadota bacterium]